MLPVKMAIFWKRAWIGVRVHTIQVARAFERVGYSGSFFSTLVVKCLCLDGN